MLDPVDGIAVYTDGAYSKVFGGGWAWIALDGVSDEVLTDSGGESPATSNRMELLAAIMALTSLHKELGPCGVLVRSDSSYLVLGCRDTTRARNANQDLWQRLDNAIQLHRLVVWEHIRGHQGNKYNEMADGLAKSAIVREV